MTLSFLHYISSYNFPVLLQGTPHLTKINDIHQLVIDEADRMVEKGHFAELLQLLDVINRWSLLTLDVLSSFKDYKRCIHISYHILDFVQERKTKFTIEQPYMLHILYCQYHACWYPGNLRSQGISRHGIDQISRKYSLASEELTVNPLNKMADILKTTFSNAFAWIKKIFDRENLLYIFQWWEEASQTSNICVLCHLDHGS